jgi:hypothetical protein
MIFRRNHSDVFRRDLPAAAFGPPAIAIGSLAMSALGTGLGAIGQANQAAAQAGQSNYMAQIARNNQIVAQRNAELARQQGEADAQKQQLKTASLEGAQRASLASQGGDVNSGSPLDILGDTARAGTTDTAAIRNNASLKAYNYELQANDAAASANDYGFQAANATANLPYAIGSSLLGSASSLGGRYLDWSGNRTPLAAHS